MMRNYKSQRIAVFSEKTYKILWYVLRCGEEGYQLPYAVIVVNITNIIYPKRERRRAYTLLDLIPKHFVNKWVSLNVYVYIKFFLLL